MGILRGIETLAIGKRKTVALFYEGAGEYVDHDGKPVKVLDAVCMDCMNNTYILESDPIDYCPHCGYRSGKVWKDYEEAREWALKHDWAWMREMGRVPLGARRPSGGWQLAFGRRAEDVLATNQFSSVRELVIDDREIADKDAGSGFSNQGGGGNSPSAFGGGANDFGGFGGGGLEID
jgi:uncharacterized membrane protein YgcG